MSLVNCHNCHPKKIAPHRPMFWEKNRKKMKITDNTRAKTEPPPIQLPFLKLHKRKWIFNNFGGLNSKFRVTLYRTEEWLCKDTEERSCWWGQLRLSEFPSFDLWWDCIHSSIIPPQHAFKGSFDHSCLLERNSKASHVSETGIYT